MALLVAHKPDVLLIDLGIPDGDGVELINKVCEMGKIESIVMTVFGDETHVMRAIEAGATGYLLQHFRAEKKNGGRAAADEQVL